MWDQTKIFSYFDGQKTVFADPLQINNDMTELLNGEVNKVLAQAHHEQPTIRCPALRRLILAIRQAFYLPEFDRNTGAGVVGDDCLKILTDFINWEEALKKNGVPAPSPSCAVEEPMSFNSHTRTSSDYGSTSRVPTGAMP